MRPLSERRTLCRRDASRDRCHWRPGSHQPSRVADDRRLHGLAGGLSRQRGRNPPAHPRASRQPAGRGRAHGGGLRGGAEATPASCSRARGACIPCRYGQDRDGQLLASPLRGPRDGDTHRRFALGRGRSGGPTGWRGSRDRDPEPPPGPLAHDTRAPVPARLLDPRGSRRDGRQRGQRQGAPVPGAAARGRHRQRDRCRGPPRP